MRSSKDFSNCDIPGRLDSGSDYSTRYICEAFKTKSALLFLIFLFSVCLQVGNITKMIIDSITHTLALRDGTSLW